VAGYSGQPQIERVFRALKRGQWLGWDPMHHWTDARFASTPFTACGLSCCSMCTSRPSRVGRSVPGTAVEELEQIKQFVLLYPPQGEKDRRAPPMCSRRKLWLSRPSSDSRPGAMPS